MAIEDILKLLNELDGRASVRQITELAEKRKLPETVTHRVKVRDALVRLKRMGAVEHIKADNWLDEVWVIIRQPSPEELHSRKRRIL